jgi:hypothetical protein
MMPCKIYVRERLKVRSGVKQPKYRLVAVTSAVGNDNHLKIEAAHFRKIEIEQIAKDVGAEVVYLEPVPEEKRRTMKR